MFRSFKPEFPIKKSSNIGENYSYQRKASKMPSTTSVFVNKKGSIRVVANIGDIAPVRAALSTFQLWIYWCCCFFHSSLFTLLALLSFAEFSSFCWSYSLLLVFRLVFFGFSFIEDISYIYIHLCTVTNTEYQLYCFFCFFINFIRAFKYMSVDWAHNYMKE